MTLRQRGAAQVSLLWLILSVVVAVVAVLFAFLQTQEVSTLRAELDAQRQAVVTANQRFSERGDELLALAKVVGFTGEGGTGFSSVDAVTAALKEAQNTFASAGNAATLEAALRAAVTDYTALTRQKASLESDIRQLRNDLEAKNKAIADARRQSDQRIAELERQLEDQRNASTTQVVNLERQRDDLRQQIRDKDQQLNELKARLAEMERRFNAELASYKIRNDILSEKLNAVARRADQPDGHVLTVSAELGRGWIDLGRKDRVRPGMVFEVRDATTGVVKGKVRVRRTEDRRSEVTILEQADRFNPVGPDDQIFNAVYDPERVLVAVLRGNGYGRYSEEDLQNMLKEVGVRVQTEITPDVDYLILGTPFFDTETGEMVPWSDDEVYKAAEAASVQIIPFRDAMDWLGL